MQLYDGYSEINWVHRGILNAYEMDQDPQYEKLMSEPCVLFDNGNGEVYSYRTLKSLMGQYGVKDTGDRNKNYAQLIYAMNPNMPSVDERLSDCEAALCEIYDMLEG